MNDQQRHSIFTLLYAVVLIDSKVVKVEVDLFLARIENFLVRTDSVEILKAKSIISTWFVQNYKLIMTEMKSPNKDDFLIRHVEKLKFYSERQDVFNIMKEIAIADEEYHENERTFIDKVAKIWDLTE